MDARDRGPLAGTDEIPSSFLRRFSLRMSHAEAAHRRLHPARSEAVRFPFASLSIVIVLSSLLMLSLFLGGWSWSSWTYAFSLGIAAPLVAIEMKRRAVITGGAALLLAFTVVVDAGLPTYFGYSPSDLSWYDLLAHFLGAFMLTLFLWSILRWTVEPWRNGADTRRRDMFVAVSAVIVVSLVFEMLEFSTDAVFGWANYHAGVDTLGDVVFDLAGVASAWLMMHRHNVMAIRRPFWHAEVAGTP
jgi:hypothetical protein